MRGDGIIRRSLDTIASIARVGLKSRGMRRRKEVRNDKEIVILGNGPSLNDTLRDLQEWLRKREKMAVNFAANTEEFFELRPEYYVLADPHFVKGIGNDKNVDSLWESLSRIDWEMRLFVSNSELKEVKRHLHNERIQIEGFNMVAAEGFSGIRNFLYDRGLAMARPRNVLIVGIMLAIIEGFGKIYLAGADHSWSKTLWVDDENRVMSRQPHFYKDNDEEHRRVDTTYAHIRLHKIYESFAIAFKSYFVIKEYAEKRGVEVINITPGSFIDAFERRKAEELNK